MTQTPLRRRQIAVCVASLCLSGAVVANPAGEQVVHGSAEFDRQGAALNITNSDGTIINWQEFSIAQEEVVRFIQSGADSSVLNRVVSGIPSEILGSLSSNGRVFLINPNGLVIGDGATIDTASFIASTLDIKDQDFIDGKLSFSGNSGSIENHGYIAAGPNGEVVLLAPTVKNHGLIKADNGQILLAAGREITLHSLNKGGISYRVSAPADKVLNIGELVASNGSVKVFADQIFQTGSISANRAYRDADGHVVLEADDSLQVSGSITVSGEGVEAGQVHLLGDQIDVLGANIDASGTSGGEVLIGGDYQGKGDVKNAANTNVDEATVINANAGTVGDGGRVIIWSDDTTYSYGKITATGGSQSGDGGFVETSGKKTLNFGQPVDVSATNGKAGTWLLDPEDITIGEAEAESIETSLNGGSNVEVRTSDDGDGEGNIYVNSSITKTEGDSAVTLTLDAHNRVEVNAPITTTAGPLNVTIKTGRQVAAVDTIAEEGGSEQPEEPATSADADAVAIENDASESDVSESDAVADASADEDNNSDSPEQPDQSSGELAENEETTTEAVDSTVAAEGEQANPEAVAQSSNDETGAADNSNPEQPTEQAAADNVAVNEENSSTEPVASDGGDSSDDANASSDDAVAQTGSQSSGNESGDVIDESLENTSDAASAQEAVTSNASVESELAVFNDENEQQIIIAADIFTGGGDVQLDAGETGDTIIAADVDTSDAAQENAGDITVEGQNIAVVDGANVDASANNAGDIKIGGGLQGQDESVDNAEITLITQSSSVSADGGETGDGGSVIVFAEQNSVISGNLSARGGSQSGNGGFIETSGLQSLTVQGTPDVGANNGDGGEWLIDPHDIVITQQNGYFPQTDIDQITGPGFENFRPVDNAGAAYIDLSNIIQGLSNGDVTISTTSAGNTGTDDGNISFFAEYDGLDLTFNSYDINGTLTLNADNNIYFAAGITADSTLYDHSFNLVLNAAGGVYLDPYSATPPSYMGMTPPPSTAGISMSGNLTISAGAGVSVYQDTSANIIDIVAGGDIDVDRALDGSDISLSSGGSVSVNAGGITGIYSAGDLSIDAVTDVLLTSSIEADGNTTISAGNNAFVYGRVESNSFPGGDISIDAGNNLLVEASVQTYGAITLTADSDNSGTGTLRIQNSGSDGFAIGRYGSGNSSASVILQGSDITIQSTGCVGGDCDGDIRINGDAVTIDTASSAGGGDILISAAADVNAPMLGSGEVFIDSRVSLDINAGRDLTLSSGDTAIDNGDGTLGYSPYSGNYFSNDVIISGLGRQNISADSITINTGLGEQSRVAVVLQDPLTSFNPLPAPIQQRFVANNFTINSNVANSVSPEIQNQAAGIVTLHSWDRQEVDIANNFTLNGVVYDMPPPSFGPPERFGPFSTLSNVSMTAYGAQVIEVGGNLTLSGAEIVATENTFGQAMPPSADSTVLNVGGLIVNEGRLAYERGVGATGGFSLTTNGTTILNGQVAQGPGLGFGLSLEDVNWTNNGTVIWESGDILIGEAAMGGMLDLPKFDGVLNMVPDSPILFENNGELQLNAQSGVFALGATTTGTLRNTGAIISNTGGGSAVADFHLFNDGGTVSVASGTLNLGVNTFSQAGANSVIALDGGNLSAGVIDITGGAIVGGTNAALGVATGGTINGNVVIRDTTVEPGFSPGSLVVNGDLDATGGGNTFVFEVESSTGMADQLIVTGTANLDAGTSNQILIEQVGLFNSDTTVAINQSFDLINANSLVLGGTGISVVGDDASVASTTTLVGAGGLSASFSRAAVSAPVEPQAPGGGGAPQLPEEPPVVIIIDDVPVVLPPSIIDVLVNLEEDEREAFLESERVKRFIKKVNMCVAKA